MISHFPVSSTFKSVPLLKNTFPIQSRKWSLNPKPLANDVLIHCLNGTCISPSFLQSQTLLERLIDKYTSHNQIDFFYLDTVFPELMTQIYYVLFKEKFELEKSNFELNKNYLKPTDEEKLKSQNEKYRRYYLNNLNKEKVQLIQNRVLELMRYFKLPVENTSTKISFLDKWKFCEIVKFIIVESFLVTQLEFCLEQHNELITTEKLFQLVDQPSTNSIFHSFCFNKKPEKSNNAIIDKLLFKFPLKQTIILNDFIALSKENINNVFMATPKTIPLSKPTSTTPIPSTPPWQK